MPRYLTPHGQGKVAIAVCGRCNLKVPYNALKRDGNTPGLYVCPECRDSKDPYKLPARAPENITLHHPRPDEPLV